LFFLLWLITPITTATMPTLALIFFLLKPATLLAMSGGFFYLSKDNATQKEDKSSNPPRPPYKEEPSWNRPEPSTYTRKAAATPSRVCKSRFDEKVRREFARHLASKRFIRNPDGYVISIADGRADSMIQEWKDSTSSRAVETSGADRDQAEGSLSKVMAEIWNEAETITRRMPERAGIRVIRSRDELTAFVKV
jgi:hypothetical protein